MRMMKLIMLVTGFIVWAVLLIQPAHVRAESARVLTGELVAQGSKTQFRVVGHNGSFTAPSGTPLDRLDGRNVQVEPSSDNRVLAIQEVQVPINPVEHGMSTVRGELVVVDPVARRFSVAGDNQTYICPAADRCRRVRRQIGGVQAR